MENSNRKYGDFILIVFLIISGWKYTYVLKDVYDIQLHDPTLYIWRGVNLNLNNLSWGPLYSLWLYFLSKLFQNRIDLFYANHMIVTILLPVLLFILLRRFKITIISSITIAFFFMISFLNFGLYVKINHFNAAMFVLFLIMLTFIKSRVCRAYFIWLCSLLLSYIRPELFLSFLALFAVFLSTLWGMFRKKKDKWLLIWLCFAAFSWIIPSTVGVPFNNRAFFAFSQLFAKNWIQWTQNEEEYSSWIDYEKIIQINFGDVHSIPEAFVSNPGLFLKHVGYNAFRNVPLSFRQFFSHPPVFFPNNFRRVENALLFLSFIFYILLSVNKWISQVKIKFRENAELFIYLGCFTLPYLFSLTIMYPREHHLVLPGIVIIIIVALLTTSHEREKDLRIKQFLLVGLIVVSATPSIEYSYGLTNEMKKQPDLRVIELFRSFNIKKNVAICMFSNHAEIYINDYFHFIYPPEIKSSISKFITENDIDGFVLTKELLSSRRFRDDKEWIYFLTHYKEFGFARWYVPNCSHEIFLNVESFNWYDWKRRNNNSQNVRIE